MKIMIIAFQYEIIFSLYFLKVVSVPLMVPRDSRFHRDKKLSLR